MGLHSNIKLTLNAGKDPSSHAVYGGEAIALG